jgi:FkbM family methyltransferase
MSFYLLKIRIRKLLFVARSPSCWRAMLAGVAPEIQHLSVLRQLGIDGIIDVGANRGQFSLTGCLAKPGLPIIAFEPIPAEAAIFRKLHAHSSQVRLIETAIGESNGTAVLHLSKRSDCSSLLPIGQRQTEMFPDTEEVGTIVVPLQRLDHLSAHWAGRTHQLLKLDVQGFELQVLRGAVETFLSCAFIYVECCEVALYDGQALRSEIAAFLSKHGFIERGRFNLQYDAGQLIQADYLFGRANEKYSA